MTTREPPNYRMVKFADCSSCKCRVWCEFQSTYICAKYERYAPEFFVCDDYSPEGEVEG